MRWLILLLFPILSFAEEDVVRKVHSHMLIHDYYSAIEECKQGITADPEKKELHLALIQSLAESGSDSEAIKHWKKTTDYFQYDENNLTLLETVAWSVLERCESAAQLHVNMASMMGAFYTHDVRAVKILTKQLHSSNAFLRAMAVKLAANYRDQTLIEEVQKMLHKEKVWYVQLEVIQALGEMRVKEASEELKAMIAHPRSSIEQKGAATSALVSMYRDLEKAELDILLSSNRAGLRGLACDIVAHLDLEEHLDAVALLLNDSSSDVRISALNTLGLLSHDLDPSFQEKILSLTEDYHPIVSISAAFLALRFDPKVGHEILKKWVFYTDPDIRRVAASAIAKSGHYGQDLGRGVLRASIDPYVKANIALGLIGQEVDVNLSCTTLYHFLTAEERRIMWEMHVHPLFTALAPSEVRHIPQIPQYPMMIDHLTRLDVLNLLVMKRFPKAEKAVKEFLTNHINGITFTASTTLLEEGESDALSLLHDLLSDSNETIRVQAALVLALAGNTGDSLTILQDAYANVDRDMKINILGALGYLGEKESIPFLIEILEEPFQILRLVAASSLIQCIYH